MVDRRVGSLPQLSMYSKESTPDTTSTQLAPPSKPPTRKHGALLPPKIRSQDQAIESAAKRAKKIGTATRKKIHTSRGSTVSRRSSGDAEESITRVNMSLEALLLAKPRQAELPQDVRLRVRPHVTLEIALAPKRGCLHCRDRVRAEEGFRFGNGGGKAGAAG